MNNILDIVPEAVKDNLPESGLYLLDLFLLGVHNKVMKKRLENAKREIELINAELKYYGIEVDYKKYFEQKLQVPLMAVEALSEADMDVHKKLLRSLS